jgi:hypothetical protein
MWSSIKARAFSNPVVSDSPPQEMQPMLSFVFWNDKNFQAIVLFSKTSIKNTLPPCSSGRRVCLT